MGKELVTPTVQPFVSQSTGKLWPVHLLTHHVCILHQEERQDGNHHRNSFQKLSLSVVMGRPVMSQPFRASEHI